MKLHYLFDGFVLGEDGLLSYQDTTTRIPPKELGVLISLLKNAGELIHKEDILDSVWGGGCVSEESLTRCIYVLRQILHDGKNGKYIDTIYGKGYRFCRPVVTLDSKKTEIKKNSIAIFPFRSGGKFDERYLHNELVKGLAARSHCGFTVLPAIVTQNSHDIFDIIKLLGVLGPDYYFVGHTVFDGHRWKIIVELVSTTKHRLMLHECLFLKQGQWTCDVKNRLINMLYRNITEFCCNEHQVLNQGDRPLLA